MMNLTNELKAIVVEASEGTVSMDHIEAAGDDLASLGMDSLVQIKILVLLEEKYEMDVDFETVSNQVLESLALLEEYVKEQLTIKEGIRL